MEKLNYEYYEGEKDKIEIVILHGLFGSGRNFRTIAKKLNEEKKTNVYIIDLCNHGKSHWVENLTIEHMADHLHSFLRNHKIKNAYLIGHSLGGKVVMYHELKYQNELMTRPIILDIAPQRYSNQDYIEYIDLIDKINLKDISHRNQLEDKLRLNIENSDIRGILMHNLVRDGDNGFKWQCYYDGIKKSLLNLSDFPDIDKRYYNMIYFIVGEHSNYIDKIGKNSIEHYFKTPVYLEQNDIGHFLNMDPEGLLAILNEII